MLLLITYINMLQEESEDERRRRRSNFCRSSSLILVNRKILDLSQVIYTLRLHVQYAVQITGEAFLYIFIFYSFVINRFKQATTTATTSSCSSQAYPTQTWTRPDSDTIDEHLLTEF